MVIANVFKRTKGVQKDLYACDTPLRVRAPQFAIRACDSKDYYLFIKTSKTRLQDRVVGSLFMG